MDTTDHDSDHTALAEALLELETQGWRSLCDGTGSHFYGDHMTAQGVMVLADGSRMSRDDVVSALAQAPPWASFAIEGPQVVPCGPDAATLVYVGRGRRDGSPEFVGQMTSTYTRQDGQWMLAVYTQTVLAAREG